MGAGLAPLTFVFLSRILFIGRFILRFRWLFVLLVFVGLAQAQLLDMSEMSESYMVENKIHKVKVEGTVHMDDRAVLSRIGIRDGQSYSPTALTEKVQSSVTSLYKSGLFDDVTAWIDYVGDGTDVDLIFKIKELPALDTAVFEGPDEVSEEDLKLKSRRKQEYGDLHCPRGRKGQGAPV